MRLAFCLLALSAVLTTGFGPPVLTDGGYPAERFYPEQIRAMRRLAMPPAISAAAALMVDVDSGQVLYARQPDLPLPPASTVKIMTALLTLKHANLTDRVTISPAAAATPGSRMGLVAGEVLTVEELLYGLLLPSGNDAAVALAEHVAGDQARFVAQMNAEAVSLGLVGANFVNPHGLDDPAERLSARSLITLTQAALAYPTFARLIALPSAQVAGRSLFNTNQLLRVYRGADGVKTGTTAAAGECLVASVTRDGHRVLVALLGSRDRYADARALLDYAAAGWRWGRVAVPDDALAWEIGPDGRAYRLRVADEAELFLPAWQWPAVQVSRQLVPTIPLTSTMTVGALHYTVGSRLLISVPLTVWPGP